MWSRVAKRIMGQNAVLGQDDSCLMTSDLMALKCVIDGLRLIHRGEEHVRNALSHVVTFESYRPYVYLRKKPSEEQLSCYYVLQGSVQVGVLCRLLIPIFFYYASVIFYILPRKVDQSPCFFLSVGRLNRGSMEELCLIVLFYGEYKIIMIFIITS